jgi:plastocyanin
MNKSNTRFAIIILSIMASSLAITSCVVAASSNATTWNVLAGGQTPNMAVQGMGFYPGVITINEGDTINWTLGGNLAHTVSFLSGASPISPDSRDATTPSGGSTYNGTGFVSSGLLIPGENYSLTFTKAGTYIYQCLIHPGMSGLVIVQPVNSSYPSNQDQYTVQGQNELLSDIDTGQKLVDNLSLTTSSEFDGTTMFHVPADIPLPTNSNVAIDSINSNVTGNATLNFIGAGILQVQVQLSGLDSNSAISADINVGTNGTGNTVLYQLGNIAADTNGDGNGTTIINGPAWFAIPSKGWFINVLNGNVAIASGDIVMHDAMYARFVPTNLTIHSGDHVEWTANNPMEIHTVTFPGIEQLPVFPSSDVVTPAGGNVHNGTGFYNSGVLHAGDNYTLTFDTPGNYSYACLVHDNLGMVGNIAVESSIGPVITDYVVTSNTAINEINPAIASGNVAVGVSNIAIAQVEFGIIDINNLTGMDGNGSAILVFDRNLTGSEGLYQSEPWGGNYAVIANIAIPENNGNVAINRIGNVAINGIGNVAINGIGNVTINGGNVAINNFIGNIAINNFIGNAAINNGNVAINNGMGNIAVSEPISVYTTSDEKDFFQVRGTINDSNISTEAILWFNKETLKLSNVTDITKTDLNITDGSTFTGKIFTYVNGTISEESTPSGQIFNLFNITGNMSGNNPILMFKDVPHGKYKAYVVARDNEGSDTTMVADIDTIIPSVPPSGGTSGGGGGSSGGGFNSQGNGTYFGNQGMTETSISPISTSVIAGGTPSQTTSPEMTTTQSMSTTTSTTTSTTAKGTPGFEVIAAIGVISAIYIFVKQRR